jgi:sensor histidine kinase YesM
MLFIAAFIPITLSQSFFIFDSDPEIPLSTIYWFGALLSVIIIAFLYFNIYYLARRFITKGAYVSYILVLVIATLGFILIKYAGEYRIFSKAGIMKDFNGVTVLDIFSNLTLYSICIASSSLSILFKQWVADSTEIENLKNQHLKNSIDEIKNRINPQFLYAILDCASEKVKSDPEQTSDMLFKLSELLRYQLYDCRRNKVLLESEIEHIRNYLLLEQQKCGNRFTFSISINGKTNIFIPPSMFMPFIEEIIRQHPAELLIYFEVAHQSIRFTCTVPETDLSVCDFQKTRQRLELLYGSRAFLNKGNGSIELQLIC